MSRSVSESCDASAYSIPDSVTSLTVYVRARRIMLLCGLIGRSDYIFCAMQNISAPCVTFHTLIGRPVRTYTKHITWADTKASAQHNTATSYTCAQRRHCRLLGPMSYMWLPQTRTEVNTTIRIARLWRHQYYIVVLLMYVHILTSWRVRCECARIHTSCLSFIISTRTHTVGCRSTAETADTANRFWQSNRFCAQSSWFQHSPSYLWEGKRKRA